MANNQIGWSQESILLNEIVKQLQRNNRILGSISSTITTTTTAVPTTTSTTTV